MESTKKKIFTPKKRHLCNTIYEKVKNGEMRFPTDFALSLAGALRREGLEVRLESPEGQVRYDLHIKEFSRLHVQVDGSAHDTPEQMELDRNQDNRLTCVVGKSVIRISNDDILHRLDDVVNYCIGIGYHLTNLHWELDQQEKFEMEGMEEDLEKFDFPETEEIDIEEIDSIPLH
jgi:very-short-patch-repair endonuclease